MSGRRCADTLDLARRAGQSKLHSCADAIHPSQYTPANRSGLFVQEGKEKQPYYIYQEGHDVMRMAGLFDCWHGPEGTLYSFTILTTDSSEKLQWYVRLSDTEKVSAAQNLGIASQLLFCLGRLHDRMPVILPNEAAEQAWLSQEGG